MQFSDLLLTVVTFTSVFKNTVTSYEENKLEKSRVKKIFFMGGSRYVQIIMGPGPGGPQFYGFGTLHFTGTV
jgi:hypothetical protein